MVSKCPMDMHPSENCVISFSFFPAAYFSKVTKDYRQQSLGKNLKEESFFLLWIGPGSFNIKQKTDSIEQKKKAKKRPFCSLTERKYTKKPEVTHSLFWSSCSLGPAKLTKEVKKLTISCMCVWVLKVTKRKKKKPVKAGAHDATY